MKKDQKTGTLTRLHSLYMIAMTAFMAFFAMPFTAYYQQTNGGELWQVIGALAMSPAMGLFLAYQIRKHKHHFK